MQGSPANQVVIGRGELVTIRVPWESLEVIPCGVSELMSSSVRLECQFCTLDNDVGFGLDLESSQKDGITEIAPVARYFYASPTQSYSLQGFSSFLSILVVLLTSPHCLY